MNPPTLFVSPFPDLREYLLATVTTRTALLCLYGGVLLVGIEKGRGTGTLLFGKQPIEIPLSAIAEPSFDTETLLPKADAMEIARQLCSDKYAICIDFLRARRHLPIFGELYAEALYQTTSKVSWVFAHALSIRSSGCHDATVAAFGVLQERISNPHKLDQHLSAAVAGTLALDVPDAARFFEFAEAFELIVSLSTQHGGPPQVVIAETTELWMPLRDFCFLVIYCTAEPNIFTSKPALLQI